MKQAPLLLSICLITVQLSACVTDESTGPDSTDPACEPTLNPVNPFVFPSTIYTGFNGRDPYRSAVSANFVAEDWQVMDTSVAMVTPTESCQNTGVLEVSALLDIVGPGTTQVVAISGDNRFTSPLIAQTYTIEQYDLGAKVYTEPSADGSRPACAACHLGPNGADHTPLVTAYFPDEVLAKVITEGVYPECLSGIDGTECECGSDPRTCIPLTDDDRFLNLPHAFALSAEESAGVVGYLRGLSPQGF